MFNIYEQNLRKIFDIKPNKHKVWIGSEMERREVVANVAHKERKLSLERGEAITRGKKKLSEREEKTLKKLPEKGWRRHRRNCQEKKEKTSEEGSGQDDREKLGK